MSDLKLSSSTHPLSARPLRFRSCRRAVPCLWPKCKWIHRVKRLFFRREKSMCVHEIIIESYIQALLKAALLLGDPRHSESIHKVVISGFCHSDHLRILHSRRTIICKPKTAPSKTESDRIPTSSSEYLIFYPAARKSGDLYIKGTRSAHITPTRGYDNKKRRRKNIPALD